MYNEEATVVEVLEQLAALRFPDPLEVLVVDDGSRDASAARVRAWLAENRGALARHTRLFQKPNGGKGSAVRLGVEHSRGRVLIVQDADLEYDPGDIPACVNPILQNQALVVYGSRLRNRANRHSYRRYYWGGVAVTWACNLLYGARLTDEPTGYKAFQGDLLRALSFAGDSFEWEPEITARLLRLDIAIHEVPVSYRPRGFAEGKKISWRDGVQALTTLLAWRWCSNAGDQQKLTCLKREGKIQIAGAG